MASELPGGLTDMQIFHRKSKKKSRYIWEQVVTIFHSNISSFFVYHDKSQRNSKLWGHPTWKYMCEVVWCSVRGRRSGRHAFAVSRYLSEVPTKSDNLLVKVPCGRIPSVLWTKVGGQARILSHRGVIVLGRAWSWCVWKPKEALTRAAHAMLQPPNWSRTTLWEGYLVRTPVSGETPAPTLPKWRDWIPQAVMSVHHGPSRPWISRCDLVVTGLGNSVTSQERPAQARQDQVKEKRIWMYLCNQSCNFVFKVGFVKFLGKVLA